jgi:hypothetical protein
MKGEIEKKGEGSWYMIHIVCSDATTPEGIAAALYMIEVVKNKFFCAKCRTHFNEFCQKRNPKLEISKKLGLFYWSIDAHNNVNIMSNKPILSHDDAYNLYFDIGGMCSVDCDENLESKNVNLPLEEGERLKTPPRRPPPYTMDNYLNKK